MQSIELAYRTLANAIILKAVEDYRNALDGISYDRRHPKAVIKEIEDFFLSDYFEMLTKVKGKYLIEELRKEKLCKSH